MSKPYSFIPFLSTEIYNVKNEKYSGIIKLNLEVLTPVHLSQDQYNLSEDKLLYKEFYKVNGIYTIPGTSIKGVIRTIAQTVSNSCLGGSDKRIKNKLKKNTFWECKEEKDNNGCVEHKNKCIICKTFGSIGIRSKVRFSDFKLINGKNKKIKVPQLRKPNFGDKNYCDENRMLKGYKLYSHGENSILEKGPVLCDYIMPKAIFKGQIIFEDLDIKQLQLLCYSIGLANDFEHKIGYGKPAYYGSVKFSIDKNADGNNNKYIKYAHEYRENNNKDIASNIKLLSEIYSYKNAKKVTDWNKGVY